MITTTWECDLCKHTQDKPDEMWNVAISVAEASKHIKRSNGNWFAYADDKGNRIAFAKALDIDERRKMIIAKKRDRIIEVPIENGCPVEE